MPLVFFPLLKDVMYLVCHLLLVVLMFLESFLHRGEPTLQEIFGNKGVVIFLGETCIREDTFLLLVHIWGDHMVILVLMSCYLYNKLCSPILSFHSWLPLSYLLYHDLQMTPFSTTLPSWLFPSRFVWMSLNLRAKLGRILHPISLHTTCDMYQIHCWTIAFMFIDSLASI